ncbi:MAG: hypothetical protein EWM50_01495 [Gottschalkiaceae bacterium]|nr:MAG: hypothetical protein EWM50_01495 [Gottschalkiaceae bacterium]
MTIEIDFLHDNLISLANGLGKLLGQACEIVVAKSNKSIIYIENSHVTSRKIGDKINQFELEALNKFANNEKYKVFTYTNREGRNIKALIFLVEDKNDSEDRIVVISFDISDFLLAKRVFDDFCLVGESINNYNQADYENINHVMNNILSGVLYNIGKPISYLNKEDKVEIVRILNEKGIFLIKGSIEYVAEKLCVSRYTIYNYLEEIRLYKID